MYELSLTDLTFVVNLVLAKTKVHFKKAAKRSFGSVNASSRLFPTNS